MVTMKNKWDLKQLYKSQNDPQIERDIYKSKNIVTRFVKKWTKDKSFLQNETSLKKALGEYEKIHQEIGLCDKPFLYFHLLHSLDQTNTGIRGRLNKIEETVTKLSNNIQFFELELSKLDKKIQKEFLNSKLLRNYKHFLETLFRVSPYILSEREEHVFNLLSKTSLSNWISMVEQLLDKQNFKVKDEKSKYVEINYNQISKYLDSKEQGVREYAAKQFNKVNSRYLEIAEFEINSVLEQKKIIDEYRGFERPDLSRHIGDDIESEVVDTLVNVVTENFDISREYYNIKARHLGKKKIKYYEKNVPIGQFDKSFSYRKSLDIVKKSFKNLDNDFYNIIDGYNKNGQYDVFPQQGKSGGAVCISMNKTLPTFILLNHNNRLNDLLTIAHESGHGIHSEFSRAQNSLNSGHPISLAEIASTFFENAVIQDILDESKEEEKFSILSQQLNAEVGTIFRQVAFYNFEKELHSSFREKGYLDKEYISDLFCKHMKAYMGDSVEEDDSMRNGWIYVSHFRYFFYVYSYASGLLIGKALLDMVKEDKNKISLVKEFLSSGSSKSPIVLFRELGLDIMKKDIWERGLSDINSSLISLNKFSI